MRWKNQLISLKTHIFQEKVSYWKKSDILKNPKTFFRRWRRARKINYRPFLKHQRFAVWSLFPPLLSKMLRYGWSLLNFWQISRMFDHAFYWRRSSKFELEISFDTERCATAQCCVSLMTAVDELQNFQPACDLNCTIAAGSRNISFKRRYIFWLQNEKNIK